MTDSTSSIGHVSGPDRQELLDLLDEWIKLAVEDGAFDLLFALTNAHEAVLDGAEDPVQALEDAYEKVVPNMYDWWTWPRLAKAGDGGARPRKRGPSPGYSSTVPRVDGTMCTPLRPPPPDPDQRPAARPRQLTKRGADTY